jgi:hypothetical protein
VHVTDIVGGKGVLGALLDSIEALTVHGAKGDDVVHGDLR